MKIRINELLVRTRQTTERVDFSKGVSFIYGPIGKGKSTVARLVNYCLGGGIERTPAIRQEFVAAELRLNLGNYNCVIERSAEDTQSLRVSWSGEGGDIGSVNAPLRAKQEPLIDADVYNFSDLVFHLCGTTPIKVRKSVRDADSPLIRLSIRDIFRYCYLDQAHLDSSFYRLEDPSVYRKSQDAMRFFTGLHSERLTQLEAELLGTQDEQRSKREAVKQIRMFMDRFNLGTETDVTNQLDTLQRDLNEATDEKERLDEERIATTHPTEGLKQQLRALSGEIEDIKSAIADSTVMIEEQRSLRAEFITAKTKSVRSERASSLLDGVDWQRCPKCGTDISERPHTPDHCSLCCNPHMQDDNQSTLEEEVLRRDLNERIDQLSDSINRRSNELNRLQRRLRRVQEEKQAFDLQLEQELARYDSAYVESIRDIERKIATLRERILSLVRLQQMPEAINALEEEAGALRGQIDSAKTLIDRERERLRNADKNIEALADEFKRVMLAISFPGVSDDDYVVLDPRNWKPAIVHGDQEWTFWDTGSGGKKTLFNVCYALAVHKVALQRNLPVPSLLIIDSPTKNISDDENPELVRSLYDEIYDLARGEEGQGLQFLLIDSDIVQPDPELPEFSERRMAGEVDAPALIPYYTGP